MEEASEIRSIDDGVTARALLAHPLRVAILERARTPRSAADIAGELGLPRQRVNHHVRALARANLLRRAGRRRKRNLYEQRYVASARAFRLSPRLVGDLAADPRHLEDRFSAEYLLALGDRLARELDQAGADARGAGKRLSTLGVDAMVRFESAAQRARFATALEAAVLQVVAEHASPGRTPDGSPAPGRPYRLVLGVYPVPPAHEGATPRATPAAVTEEPSDETTP